MITLSFDWEVNIINICVSILSVILIFIVYRLLDKRRERKQLETIFIRIKNIISNYWQKVSLISLNFPYLKFQKENLGKLGLILNEKKKFEGFLLRIALDEEPNVNINILEKVESINILDKYFLKENFIYEIEQSKELKNKEEFERILSEIKNYTKRNYNIKIKISNKLN